MSRVRSFLALSSSRRRQLLLAFALLAVVKTGLAVSSFRRTAATIDRIPQASSDVSRADVRWAVHTAGAQWESSCLDRALVAYALCRRHGHPADLYVGVEGDGEGFGAHSWVESDGTIVVGDEVDLDRYEPLGVVSP